MQLEAVAVSSGYAAPMTKPGEATEGRGPDHDGDKDDPGSFTKSATAPGVGNRVDVNA